MSEIQNTPSPSKNSVNSYIILIVVFSAVIFTLLYAFNAFHKVDYSRKNAGIPSIERSMGGEKAKPAKAEGHANETHEKAAH